VLFGSLGGGDKGKTPCRVSLPAIADEVISAQEDDRQGNPDTSEPHRCGRKKPVTRDKDLFCFTNRARPIQSPSAVLKRGIPGCCSQGHEKTMEDAEGMITWNESRSPNP